MSERTQTPSMETEPKPAELPLSPRNFSGPFRKQTNGSVDIDDYFIGPRDIDRHSKWPVFLRLHGSILPEMVLPIFFILCWATLITCISKYLQSLAVSNVLLTVLGFVVGLALSFRSSTAYERYAEGRKYWSQLMLTAHSLARLIYLHSEEREGELGKQDLLAKITGLNLILAFAVSLKHKLRFEPLTDYDDLHGLIGYLDTYAKEAQEQEILRSRKPSYWKALGEYLGVSFAASNPRKLLKRSKKPLGNLPLEILTYLSAYVDGLMEADLLKMRFQSSTLAAISGLNDVLTGTDRILNTPLPLAYSIAIAQITWVYVLLLPFQLYDALGWVTIPGTAFAAYIILGISLIGREIENPFGNDVNDLPLDNYCAQLASELDIIASAPMPKAQDFMARKDNLVLFPLSASGYEAWNSRSEDKIREALRARVQMSVQARKSMQEPRDHHKGEV